MDRQEMVRRLEEMVVSLTKMYETPNDNVFFRIALLDAKVHIKKGIRELQES